MSNSPLVNYTNISPNKTSPRKHAIDTITIHCIVGQWTAKQGCDYFASTKRQSSANYVVGKDGSIGLSVDEKDRAWTSGGKDKNGNPIRVNGISGSDNDHRAVTIEVASDTKSPYAVTDAAYEALIKLCADICKRNNIKQLLWKADKSLVGQINKQNMTVHRWFANKPCPGDYLYERHSDIAAKVNAILKGAAQKPSESKTQKILYKVQIGTYSEKANAEKALAKAKAAGFTDAFITTEERSSSAPAAPAPAVKKGSKVKVKPDAKTYTGGNVASFVYNKTYTVDELVDDRAVLDKKGICTPFNVKDLILV
jgi:hypothetical protein